MKKMPPLPNRKVSNVQGNMQVVSNKIKIPQRYNSIERILKDCREECGEDNDLQKEDSSTVKRQNALMKRPLSARQNSGSIGVRSIGSRGSRDSKESLNSRDSSYRRRQSPHYNMKMRVSMPSITAHSWVLYEMKEEKFVYGKASFKKREVASLTKIMNLITMLKLL
jgi:hypothetical protein